MDHAWVICNSNDGFSVWTSHILFPASLLVLHVKTAATRAIRNGLSTVIWSGLHALQIHFLHGLKFLSIGEATARSTGTLTYLVLRLDIPLGILKELIDVLTEHLLKISVVDASLVASCTLTLLLLGVLASCLRPRVRGHTVATLHETLLLGGWGLLLSSLGSSDWRVIGVLCGEATVGRLG